MAIDNLENKCLNRKEKSALKYPLNSLMNLEDPKNFNLFQKRSKILNLLNNLIRDIRKGSAAFYRVVSERLLTDLQEH